ncbi:MULTISPECIES: hypothetical protein [unclassified Bradyrhizobium]|uniref:hypothetical protein n=1 Tax=unclassified Bradyrhizobium TaxID=2631580 RepID=UPI0024E0BE9C|nr:MULTISPECIES: hypothetical protein [unclassified Bradyrhizobium]
MTAFNHARLFSRLDMPEFCCCHHTLLQTEGAGNAGLLAATHGPPATKKQAAVTTGPADIRHSLRDGFHAYFALSPVPGLLATVAIGIIITRRLGIGFGMPGPRDFTSASCRSSARHHSTLRHPAATASRAPRSVTIAKRPSCRARDQITIASFLKNRNINFNGQWRSERRQTPADDLDQLA